MDGMTPVDKSLALISLYFYTFPSSPAGQDAAAMAGSRLYLPIARRKRDSAPRSWSVVRGGAHRSASSLIA